MDQGSTQAVVPAPPGALTSVRRRLWDGPETIARTLGWVSIGLGAYEVARAGRLLGRIGGHRTGIVRLYGVREIANGVALLNARAPGPFLWGRVAGDGLDLVSLVLGFGRSPAKRGRTLAIASVAGITLLDVAAARAVSEAGFERPPAEFTARRSLTVRGASADLIARWRDPAVVAQVMAFLGDLEADAPGRTRWTVRSILGRDLPGNGLGWKTTVQEPEQPDRIAWTSGTESLPVTGEALFRPGDARLVPDGEQATIVTLELHVGPADAILGRALVQALDRLPLAQIVDKALRRFKSLVETGEIPTTEHQPAARPDPS